MRKFLSALEKRRFKKLFIKFLNQKIRGTLRLFEIDDWEKLFCKEKSDQIASKRGSFLSPIVDLCLEKTAKEMNLDWKFVAGEGHDSILKSEDVEHKISLSESNAWTGHGYSKKRPYHLLIKISIEIDVVNKLFIAFVKFGENNNNYSKSSETNSYATIKISCEDYFSKNYDIIIGNLIPKQKWCETELEKL